MKKSTKIAIACAVAVAGLMAGLIVANPFGTVGNSENPTENPTNAPTNTPTTNGDTTEGEGEVTNPVEQVEATSRISPGKFYFEGYLAGEHREGLLTIWNLNDHDATFSVDYRVPDSVIVGYYRPTEDVRNWVWISDKWPTVPANGKVDITIRLGMPHSAIAPGPKWEFWIGVIDQSQTGWIRTELASRFLVTMG